MNKEEMDLEFLNTLEENLDNELEDTDEVNFDIEDEEEEDLDFDLNELISKIDAKIEEIKQSKDYLQTKSKFFICGDFNMEISWYDWFKDFAKQFS